MWRAFAWCMGCFWLIGIGCASAQASLAQAAPSLDASKEAGLPFIRNFGPAEYAGAPQNWSVIRISSA